MASDFMSLVRAVMDKAPEEGVEVDIILRRIGTKARGAIKLPAATRARKPSNAGAYNRFYLKIPKPPMGPQATKMLFDSIASDPKLLEEYYAIIEQGSSKKALNGWLATRLKSDLQAKSGQRKYVKGHLLISSYLVLL